MTYIDAVPNMVDPGRDLRRETAEEICLGFRYEQRSVGEPRRATLQRQHGPRLARIEDAQRPRCRRRIVPPLFRIDVTHVEDAARETVMFDIGRHRRAED